MKGENCAHTHQQGRQRLADVVAHEDEASSFDSGMRTVLSGISGLESRSVMVTIQPRKQLARKQLARVFNGSSQRPLRDL